VITLLAYLLGVEAVGTVAFLALLLRGGGWRSTRVGRHLVFYGCALSSIYAGTLLRVLWRVPATFVLLLILHGAFAVACWHRVYVILREQRD
jgi:hypothetical protein